jgi:predicted metal-dependent phosphoesterase TrpH
MAEDSAARIRIDMHLHTRRSFDSLNDPDAVLRTARERGLDVICVTDHNQIATALELKLRFPERIIVGEEVKTAEGVDVIGLYIHEVIPKGTPALETCQRIHDQGGIVYVPHPYAPGKGGDGRLLDVIADHVDAIEGFNARIHDPALNERAVRWGREHDVPLGAGSDAHTLREIGRAYADVPAFEDSPYGLLHALRRGTIHGEASSRAVHVASTYAKVRKFLPGA